jgi:hypothetical protein
MNSYEKLSNDAMRYLIQTRFKEYDSYSFEETCEMCNCNKKSPNHEANCTKLQGIHTTLHNYMVNHLVSKLKKYHAREVNKENNNRLPNNKKPDILLEFKGRKYYLDIGFTVDPKKYYDFKINIYSRHTPIEIVPIIFGKDCTIYEKSELFLR